jgi:hypothetical protein
MNEETILDLVRELRVLKTVTIMSKVSGFDEYLIKAKFINELFHSRILE